MMSLYLGIGLWIGVIRGLVGGLPAVLSIPPAESVRPASAGSASGLAQSALLGLSDEELFKLVESDQASLGSISIGTPSGGILLNPVPLRAEPGLYVVSPDGAFGTAETMEFIRAAAATVGRLFPGAPSIGIGDISFQAGGRMKRHETHQSGRDVDVGLCYKNAAQTGFVAGTAANLDLPRNWVLVRSLLVFTDVETILLDAGIQRLLYAHALKIGEDKDWLDRVFQVGKGSVKAVVIHVPGHRNHYHVRFTNRLAQELGRRVYPQLIKLERIKPPVYSVPHSVRNGETLSHLARRYGTSIRAIQQYNGLSGTLIRAGRTLRIPLRGVSAPAAAPVVVPARLLPPSTPESLAGIVWPVASSNHL
jgi:murein endopeptidase